MGTKRGLDQSELRHPRLYHVHFLSIVFCFWFSTYIYIPTFGVYLGLLDIGYYAIGIIMGGYGIMQIMMRFPLGIVADKYQINGKLMVIFGFIASFASALMLASTSNFLPIFLGRVLAGVTAAMWVVLTIWYSSSFNQKQSLKAMGLLQTTTVGSQFISMVISGWIASVFGYQSLFWIGAIFALIGFILVLVLPSGRVQKAEEARKSLRKKTIVRNVLKDQTLWSLSLLSLFAHAVLFATIFGFSPIYFNDLNSNSSAIMLLVVAFMLPHILASIILSMKRNSISDPFRLLFYCLGIGAVSLLLMGFKVNWLFYCFLHIVLGSSLGFVFPILLDEVSKNCKVEASKTAMGLFQSIYSIGIVAGPLVAGYFARQINLGAVFIMSAVFLITGGVVSLIEMIKRSKKERKKSNFSSF